MMPILMECFISKMLAKRQQSAGFNSLLTFLLLALFVEEACQLLIQQRKDYEAIWWCYYKTGKTIIEAMTEIFNHEAP